MIVLMKVISYAHDTYNCSTDSEGNQNVDQTALDAENANLKHAETPLTKKETCENNDITPVNPNDSLTDSCNDVDGCVENKMSTAGFEDKKNCLNEEYPEKISLRVASSRRKKVLIETSGEQRVSVDNNSTLSILKYRNSKVKKSSSTEETLKSKDGESSRTSSMAGIEYLSHESRALWMQCLELLGYLLHPGTIIFGPWCSLSTYRQILQPINWVSE